MPRARAQSILAIACCLAGLPLGHAAAQPAEPKGVPRILIDRQLQGRPVQLLGLDERTLQYRDAAGLTRREPLGEFLALLPAPQPETPAAPTPTKPTDAGSSAPAPAGAAAVVEHPISASVLELTDGQRFAGSLVTPGAGRGETVRWAHPILGALEFKLDQVRRIRLREASPGVPPPAPSKDEDTLLLANGDRLTGFIETIGASVAFNAGSKADAKPAEIPLERIQEIVLSNPAQEPPAHAVLAYFRDGSIIACRSLKTGRLGELTLTRSPQDSEAEPKGSEGNAPADGSTPVALRLDDLAAAAIDPPALMPLSHIDPAKQEPTGGRRWTRPLKTIDPEHAMLGAVDLELPGPMQVEWDLPAGAIRLLTEAELPRQNWTWGDLDLVVSAVSGGAETELARQHLSAEQPRAIISTPLGAAAGSRLRIRIEAGPYGPIQDRIILHRPLLQIDHKPG